LWVAGERCDVFTLEWISELIQKPVLDHYWQTETGWPIIAPCLGINPKSKIIPGSSNKAVPGYDVRVMERPEDDDELISKVKEISANEMGHIVIKLPLPPGTLQTLYKNDDRFVAGYLRKYQGYYLTGDAGYKDQNGNIFVMSRTDDIINVAAHRLSTSAMEEVLQNHPEVAESTVIGALDVIKGQTPIGFIVLKSDSTSPIDQIKLECVALVRKKVISLFIDVKDWTIGRLQESSSCPSVT
jgi:propionyl-CoA synthetase